MSCVWILTANFKRWWKYTAKVKISKFFENNQRWNLLYEPRHDRTNKVTARPAKTQISLGVRPVWSAFSLCAQWVAKDLSFLHPDSEESDQTGRMPRLIWVFAGRTLTLLVLSCRGSYFPEALRWVYTIKVNLVKVWPSLTNFDQNAVYTIKVVQSFKLQFQDFGGKFLLHTHISRIMDPTDEQYIAFVICIYQKKAGDKANVSLHKGLVAPPPTK